MDNKVDLSERTDQMRGRHPWEIARVASLKSMLKKNKSKIRSVLDIGCGDGFTVMSLCDEKQIKIYGVDPALSEVDTKLLEQKKQDSIFCRDCSELPKQTYDLILLLDVLEHVEDDKQLLRKLVTNSLQQGGLVLITVPAFQFLFSEHDRYLKHYRRYNLNQLHSTCNASGLQTEKSGYIFFSLLLIRLTQNLANKILRQQGKFTGVGKWSHGPVLTKMIGLILFVDQFFCRVISRFGIHLPGLTVWGLCKKQ